MAQSNLNGVNASKHSRAQRVPIKVYHYTKLKPLQLDKPIPNLKTIPLATTPVCDVVTVLAPPKPTLVNLVDGSSPHIPSIKKDSNTNSPKNPTAIIAANTATKTKESSGKMAKKNKAKRLAAMLAAQNAKQAARQDSAKAFMPGAAQTTTLGAAQATTLGAAQATTLGAAQATTPGAAQATTPCAPQVTTSRAPQATLQGAAQAAAPDAAQDTIQATAQVSGNPSNPPNTNQQTSGNDPTPPKPFTNQQKKKWLKYQQKIWQKKKGKGVNKNWMTQNADPGNEPVIHEEPALPETSQDGSPNIIGQANEAPNAAPTITTDRANQGPIVPIIQKPSITLITKKNLQQEMVKQRLNWIKPDANAAGNVPGTSAAPQIVNQSVASRDSPQIIETPQSAGLVPGSTIPILENRTVEPTPRINAGSFFKKAAPPQPAPSPRIPVEPYIYRYPKGIPRSFLLQQEKSLEASGSPITADSPIWPNNPNMNTYQMNAPILVQPQPSGNVGDNMNPAISPIFVQTENPVDVEQPYSPSDVYSEQGINPEPTELDSESSEQNQAGQKRLSAFQRLGPVSQPKKPKLTINLNLKKEQPVREVVNETEDDSDKYTPVHLRQDILTSTDEIIVKYLPIWPWRKNITVRRSATARNSRGSLSGGIYHQSLNPLLRPREEQTATYFVIGDVLNIACIALVNAKTLGRRGRKHANRTSVMILEQEKMEKAYEKDNVYIQITVKGYPSTWTKERVLDAVLDSVRGYSLIPCFTEFSQHECKFLVLRSRSALVVLHKTGFYIHKDGVELAITVAIPVLSGQLLYIPRIILRKRIVMGYMDKKLNLSAFTLQDDISHFIYFPLNRLSNQSECLLVQSAIDWNQLVELDLSHNRLTTITGFDLVNVTPRLKHLDLSHNCLEKITVLLNDRQLPLKTIRLEGNPLCHDYIDPQHYIKVIKMMFPAVVEIDGVPIHLKGELPNHKQNYCPEEAQEVAEKFLEIFFPLFDSGPDHRSLIQGMYEDDATLTITYCYKLRYSQIYRNFRNLFLYARFLDEGETDSVVGAMAITKLINRWPHTEHDPFTFTVDVLYHSENTIILRISGVLKLTAETLAEDEHLLSFTRTLVLHSEDGTEYKIHNEMVYWHEPSVAAVRSAFRVNTISQKNFNLKIESTTDEDLRDKFLKIFMKLTTMDKKICERCLDINNWNFKLALEHFTKLLKLNNLDSLTQEVQADS